LRLSGPDILEPSATSESLQLTHEDFERAIRELIEFGGGDLTHNLLGYGVRK
jgi:hypothetical protein